MKNSPLRGFRDSPLGNLCKEPLQHLFVWLTSLNPPNESKTCSRWHLRSEPHSVSDNAIKSMKNEINRCVQRESFGKVIETLSKGENIKSKIPLSKLNPFLDEKDLLRVGGRFKLFGETPIHLSPYRSHCVHGLFELHQCTSQVFCNPWSCKTTAV